MNAKEFISYFKGGIELGQLIELNQANFKIISKQLNSIDSEVSAKNNFCIWLKGVFDVSETNQISAKQLKIIVEKLNELNTNSNYSHLDKTIVGNGKMTPRC